MKKMTKKLNSFLFVVALIPALFFTSNIFANDATPHLKIVPGKNNAFTLISNNAKDSYITIRIFDDRGLNLLEEKIEVNRAFSKSYDLSKIPNGIYEVEIEDSISFRKYFVNTTLDTIKIIEKNKKKIFKPTFILKEKLLKLNLLNLGNREVELSLINEKGENIYSEKFQNSIVIHKAFNLSNLSTGKYSVEVKTEGKYFYSEVKLK
jgi:hypothetical protein